MKNKIWKIILILSVLYSLTGCGIQSPQDEVTNELGISCKSASIISSEDTHGGFHNDGTTFYAMSFLDDQFLDNVNTSSYWNKLPLDDNLNALLYGINNENYSDGPYVADEEGHPLFPTVENGYYYFEDRHYESKDIQDDSEVLNRCSFNFTIAVYDVDTKTLYFCEFDT